MVTLMCVLVSTFSWELNVNSCLQSPFLEAPILQAPILSNSHSSKLPFLQAPILLNSHSFKLPFLQAPIVVLGSSNNFQVRFSTLGVAFVLSLNVMGILSALGGVKKSVHLNSDYQILSSAFQTIEMMSCVVSRV